jgi:RNA polymerase sigma-70 factor (ECF subfamily)
MKLEVSICEEKTYSDIYTSEAEKLRNHLYYKCGDLVVAEDLMQEAFIKLWNKCAEVLIETVTGFLYTVSNRLFIDKIRSEKVALNFEKSQLPESNSPDPYFILRTEEFREKIETSISNLPEGQREAFLLNRIDKLTYKEIAERLEISTTAVENRMNKALLKLKTNIEEFKQYNI